MNFCPYLVRDVNFEPDAIQPCCNTRALNALPRFAFSGGKVNMLDYTQHIQKSFALLQNRDICDGCPELIEIDTGDNDFGLRVQFHSVSFNMHRWLCNCKCVYCDFHKKIIPAYSIIPAIKSLYTQHAFHEKCFFSWGGGESTILREFEEASTLIYNYGYSQYIHTNALRHSPAVSSLLEKGAAGINISLDSGTQETYKLVKGLDGFTRVVDNIRTYIAAAKNKNAITIKYIIFNVNNSQDEIEKFFRICQSVGVKKVEFSFDFREVNAGEISRVTLHAAALFKKIAQELEIQCTPFFVDKDILKKVPRCRDR